MSAHSHRPKATEQTAKPTQEAPFFQAKLTVNTPGDAYEQEADAVADQVMRMQEGDAPIVQRMPLTSVGDVQRKCAACEQEEEQQAQRKETIGGDASGKAAPGIVSDVLSSGAGRPMEGGTRQFMESRFGQDFSQVRVHTDSRAAESASAIQARAYTSGRDIVFGAGQYQPESEGGKRLLAHELAHVGQQQNGKITREIQNTDEASEQSQRKEPTFELVEANFPEGLLDESNQTGVVQRGDGPAAAVESIANTAQVAWDIMKDNRPVTNTTSDFANAVPENTPWGQLTNWASEPMWAKWKYHTENVFGSNATDVYFKLKWDYNGQKNGTGRYINHATCLIESHDIAWGNTFNANAVIRDPLNRGTVDNPIAALPVDIRWTESNLIQNFGGTWEFEVRGDGGFRQL